MSVFRFLHIADVHLDTSFLCRTEELRGRLREALRSAFKRSVDCAIDEAVDAVLIAGDLFDGDRLSYRTEHFLVDQLKRLDSQGIPTVYVAGNHDPGGRRGPLQAISWPESFHYVAGNDVEIVDVRDRSGETRARIVAAGHATARDSVNLAKTFPRAEGKIPHVGLLHTMVAGARDAAEHDRYAPCSVDDLRRPGFRYWALGHVHARQQVCDQSNAYYSGNLQGRSPRETGPKGGLLVSLRDGLDPEITFRSFAPVHWAQLRMQEIESHDSLQNLTGALREHWDAYRDTPDNQSQPDAEYLLRVTLAGSTPLYDRLVEKEHLSELEETLSQALGVLDVEVRTDGIARPVDLSEHRGQPHVLGETLSVLEEAARDERLLENLAPDVLAGAASKRGEERFHYLRSLLLDLDREAAMRLLKEHGH